MRGSEDAARLEIELSERAAAYALESVTFATARARAVGESYPAAAPLMASVVAKHGERCLQRIGAASPET